jgi:hypothetical protein
VSDRLVVIEDDARFMVAYEDDPDDWLCAFAKSDRFPAERWASDMVRTWNARLELSRTSSRRRPAASDR